MIILIFISVLLFILGKEVVQISGRAIEGVNLDTEVLKHGGEEIIQRRLLTIVTLLGIVVALVLQSATSEDDWQIPVGVSGCITDATAEEYHGVIEERTSHGLG